LDKLGFGEKWWYNHWREIKGCFKVGGKIIVDVQMVEQFFKELASVSKTIAPKSGTVNSKNNRHGLFT
jgi:hypothetical protein